MAPLPLPQLWQHGTKTCRVTPASQPGPYVVVVQDGDTTNEQRTFPNHDDAVSFAIEELRRATALPRPK